MRSPSPFCVSPPPDRCADRPRTFRIARPSWARHRSRRKGSARAWHSFSSDALEPSSSRSTTSFQPRSAGMTPTARASFVRLVIGHAAASSGMHVTALRASDTLASGENEARALSGGLTGASSGTRECRRPRAAARGRRARHGPGHRSCDTLAISRRVSAAGGACPPTPRVRFVSRCGQVAVVDLGETHRARTARLTSSGFPGLPCFPRDAPATMSLESQP